MERGFDTALRAYQPAQNNDLGEVEFTHGARKDLDAATRGRKHF